jgi:hypothetical protein
MRPTILILAVMFASLVGFVGHFHSAYAVDYTSTALDVPGGNYTAPHGVNDAGQIAGAFASNGMHGFLYSGGAFAQIDMPVGTYATWDKSFAGIRWPAPASSASWIPAATSANSSSARSIPSRTASTTPAPSSAIGMMS